MLYPVFKTNRLAELINEQWGSLRIPDLHQVYNVARPLSVLEIGCFQGVSTEFWLLHCGRVVAVDPWPDIAVRRAFMVRCGHYPGLQMREGFSPAALPDPAATEPFDLIYIDGDHSYEAVKKDIMATLPLVHENGWVGGHDYHGPFGECEGVARAVDELLGPPVYRFGDGSWLTKKAWCHDRTL